MAQLAPLAMIVLICSFGLGSTAFFLKEKIFRKEDDKELRRKYMQKIDEAEQLRSSYILSQS